MRDDRRKSAWLRLTASLAGLFLAAGVAWGQQRSSSSSDSSNKDQSSNRKDSEVVRVFGPENGYRTELRTDTHGKLSDEELREASVLVAEVIEEIQTARDDLEADDTKEALKEVNKAREAIKAIRQMMPTTNVHTKTTSPDGKVLYEDEREVHDARIPLFEGMLHAQTLAPIIAARRNAMEIAGVQVVSSERVITEAIADIDAMDVQLKKATHALDQNKTETAQKALAMALVRGIDLRFNKEDSELAAARDAMWLAKRSLEENNVAQAVANLAAARTRLRLYREVVSQEQRVEVDQMLREIEQLEAQLRQERNQTVSRAERSRQGHTVTSWWDRINSWFRRHL